MNVRQSWRSGRSDRRVWPRADRPACRRRSAAWTIVSTATDRNRIAVRGCRPRRWPDIASSFIRDELIPRLDRTTDELTNTLRGLSGRFVPAGPSGAPTRGMARILPTGRNFYSIDIHTIPTETAWKVGTQAAERLIEKYRAENDGQYPRSVGIVVWGTSTMRTHGDDIAEILHLMGVPARSGCPRAGG